RGALDVHVDVAGCDGGDPLCIAAELTRRVDLDLDPHIGALDLLLDDGGAAGVLRLVLVVAGRECELEVAALAALAASVVAAAAAGQHQSRCGDHSDPRCSPGSCIHHGCSSLTFPAVPVVAAASSATRSFRSCVMATRSAGAPVKISNASAAWPIAMPRPDIVRRPCARAARSRAVSVGR